MGRYHGPESINLRIGRCCHCTVRIHASRSEVVSIGFEHESGLDGLKALMNTKMTYKKGESRALLRRIATVLLCLNQLIHHLGQDLQHRMLNANKQNSSQLISQSASTEISRRQSRPDTRLKECGLLGAYLLERMSGLGTLCMEL